MGTSPSREIEQPRPDLGAGLAQFDAESNRLGYVGLKLFPVIEVAKAFGQYPVVKIKDVLKRRRNTKRAADGSYGRGGGGFDFANYATQEYGFEERVDEHDAHMFGDWIDAEQMAADRSLDAVLLDFESRIIDAAFHEDVHATDVTNPWTSASSGTPITDVINAKILVRARCGLVPNALAVEWEIVEKLKLNAQVIDRMGSLGYAATDPKSINEQMLAAAFEVDEFIVSKSMENTANEGQDASLAALFPADKGLLFVKSADPELRRPRLGNVFHWGFDGSKIGGVVESYYSANVRSDVVRVRLETFEQRLYASCAEQFTGLKT